MSREYLLSIAERFRSRAPTGIDWCLRLVTESGESLSVRRDVPEAPHTETELGAFISVNHSGSCAYAATGDLTTGSLLDALHRAHELAHQLQDWQLFHQPAGIAPTVSGEYESTVIQPWHDWPLAEKYDYLRAINRELALDAAIVDWSAALEYRRIENLICGPETCVQQTLEFLSPLLMAVANHDADSETRTFGFDRPAQAGLEHLETIGYKQAASRTAEQALTLLNAPECPETTCDVLLMPSQMMLQIHESIGHPLELDRILGDERNYAGTSFVTTDMFGQYQYGSELLNVVFDPAVDNELANYAYDDAGTAARREYLIRHGRLERPLGSMTSQHRAGLNGVANARCSGWNRPPIDRMANINIEPGDQTMADMIAGIEYGVLMDTNRSWSIDDSRNKFQFGCEYGRLIENGQLGELVRNPSYRGISSQFWRRLKAVGDAATFDLHGVHTCGKGEPNQALHAGHASPACVFTGVAVFGGE